MLVAISKRVEDRDISCLASKATRLEGFSSVDVGYAVVEHVCE
jgi:hypothetical protein